MAVPHSRWRIQNALYALVLCALCPAMLVLVAQNVESVRAARREARNQAGNVAWAIAGQQKNLTENTHNLLTTLARLPELRTGDAAVLEKIFAGLIADNPNYAAFLAIDAKGMPIASNLSGFPGAQVADRRYFLEAVRTRSFAAGEFVYGRVTGVNAFHFAAPVIGDDGDVTGVVAASVKLDNYDTMLSDVTLPAGWRYVLLDHAGYRLHRYPRDDRLGPGTPALPEIKRRIEAFGADHGDFRATGGDGKDLSYAFVRLRLSPGDAPYMTVLVGIPNPDAISALIDAMKPPLAILSVTTMLALLIARLLGRKLISEGVERLYRASLALAAGNLTARAGDVGACRELSELGHTFDTMADNLAKEITERRKAVDGLKSAEEKYRTVVENSPVGVFRTVPEGRYILANQALADMLGFATPGELIDDVADIADQVYDVPSQRTALIETLERKGEVFDFEAKLRRKDGSHFFASLNCRAVKGEDGRIKHMDGFVSDISARKELERIREDVDRILRHDLRTPLQGILAVPGLLRQRNSLDPEDRKLLSLMTRSGLRMLHMINMSLVMFKIETGAYQLSPAPIDILKILRDAAVELRVVAEAKDLALNITADGRDVKADDAFYVSGEEPLCFSMLENLLRNAFEASPPGGEIAATLSTSPPSLRLANAGEVPLAVRDSFFTKYATSGKKEGTGLGAYSAMRIARVHGFSIELDATRPGETAIVIGFPEASLAKTAASKPHDAKAPPAPANLRVLVAEDGDTARAMLALFLADDGHETVCVKNGEQALCALAEGCFDLVLLDMMMPELDGPQTAARIRADISGTLPANIPILGITASDNHDDASRCLSAGMDHVLAKPVRPDELRNAMAKILTERPHQGLSPWNPSGA